MQKRHAAGEDRFEDPLGDLAGAGVPLWEQQHGGERASVDLGDQGNGTRQRS